MKGDIIERADLYRTAVKRYQLADKDYERLRKRRETLETVRKNAKDDMERLQAELLELIVR